jgi:hypothetical protein
LGSTNPARCWVTNRTNWVGHCSFLPRYRSAR